MIGYDATLAERANSAGTGELICLFLLFVLFFCMLTSVCVIISFFLFVYSICVHLFIDQPLASCSVSPSPSACRAQGRHSRMQVSDFTSYFCFTFCLFVLFYIYILTRHCFLFLFLLQRWRQRQQKWQQWQTTKSWQAMNGLWASGCMTATTVPVHKLCL